MSTEINPFLGVNLFRTDKDQERLDKEKTELANSKLKISFTFHHGWYSQTTADRDGSFEEWENMDGATVSVTHVTETTMKGKPCIDARYVGTLSKKLRTISLDGEEISNKKTVVLYGTSRMSVQGAATVRDAIAKSGIYFTTNTELSLRVEEDGETVYDGKYTTGLDIPLEGNHSHTVIIKAIEKPVVQQVQVPAAQKNYVHITYDGTVNEVRLGSSLGMVLRTLKLSGTDWMFNGVKIDNIQDFILTQDGTIRKVHAESAHTQFVSEPVYAKTPTPTPSSAYVDSKLSGIRSSEFQPVKDVEGNLCHSQKEIDESIKTYYRTNRKEKFAWGTITDGTSSFHMQCQRRFPIGSNIVAAKIKDTWFPVCLKDDWDRVLDVTVARW